MRTLFTSESVTEGHPDKICDQISDGILDALLAVDPNSRCACETTAEPGAVHIMGEITTAATVNYIEIARRIIREIGYTKPEYGFDADTCEISCSLHTQSADIAQGVDLALEAKEAIDTDGLGAGDQGMMFGYACDETPELMPLPITLAHRITRRLAAVRKSGELGYLRPDGKAQVTVEYENGKPVRVNTVVLSTQHDENADADTLRRDMIEKVIKPCIPAEMLDAETKYFINPTGRFVLGGPAADTGLTGRKIIVDTYGGYARHGGGAFSGKDATKVDRSAAYMARNIAKTIVEAGAAHRCEIQLSYAIGVARPVSIYVETYGTNTIPEADIFHWIERCYDLRPAGIIKALGLRAPVFGKTAAYGHFGRGHHRHAGRERRLAGPLQSAEQSLRRCTIPLDILVYRRTRFDAVRTLLRDHLPSDDPLTDPAVRFGHAVEKVSSPWAPRNQKTAGTFVLHVVRRTGHRNRQHGLVPDAAGCIELPDRNDNGAACAGRMRFAVHHRTQDRAPFPRQSRRSAGSRTEKHDPCDLDGTDLPQSRFIGRPRFLCGVAEHREFLPVVAPAARQRLKTAIAVSCSRRV